MKIKDAQEADVRALLGGCYDVKFEKHGSAVTVYCDGMADHKQLSSHVLPRLDDMIRNDEIPLLGENEELEQLAQAVFSGYAVFLFFSRNGTVAYEADISNPPGRSPEESASETSIRGPRDGFTEELSTNIALIRKRLKTESLRYEHFTIGKRGKTALGLLYIQDVIHPPIVEEARNRIRRIDVDSLIGSGQLEEYLSDSSDSIFPLVDYIGRPDFAVETLLRGRFVILADGFPIAIIGPTSLTEQLKSPEDAHFSYAYTFMQRLLRLVGLIVAMTLPGLYVAFICYNIDQVPFYLMSTIAVARAGIPFPAPLEALFMMGLFELFREAGIRLPKAVGQTVTVVGGLIIGDAAIRSGLASPTLLMVIAVTAVASFSLVNQSLTGTVTIVRIYILIISSCLGIYGFCIGVLSVLAYTCTLTSFGTSYWAPLDDIRFKSALLALANRPFKSKKQRPGSLHSTDTSNQGG
ncbi:spore germination protein [Paenibacillus albus]|uniref:Spore germination protein n=1 Tax=Paenibacillus albus TaxID=2495582 RepID=A0A3S8ZYZ1_9BACL|nr:spore germination protein [Paenibacillus albus]AZN38624.1 spore germination protein [Paenibacillus albus]